MNSTKLVLGLLLRAAGVAALVAFTAVLVAITSVVRHTNDSIDQVTEASIATVREATAELRLLRLDVDGQLAGARRDVLAIASKLDAPLAQAGTALEHVAGIREDINGQLMKLGPVVDHAANVARLADEAAPLFLDCDHNVDCVFNRYVGASKGIEQASLNFGAMSRDVRSSLPPALGTFNQIGANIDRTTNASARASEATALTMANLAKATKPLPAWLRIPLSVTGAMAPTVAGAITAAAATGAFH